MEKKMEKKGLESCEICMNREAASRKSPSPWLEQTPVVLLVVAAACATTTRCQWSIHEPSIPAAPTRISIDKLIPAQVSSPVQ